MRFLVAAIVLFSITSLSSGHPKADADENGLTDVNTSHSTEDPDDADVDSPDPEDSNDENGPTSFDSSHPKDFMNEDGRFNVSKWWAVCRFIECKKLDGDAMAK
ncbi:hypothetical protein AAVH_24666 [Aphelenchoides avenae]|nr:hypothetical protein AAVH_24666 [Aphelenchus avenae]